MPLRPTKSSMRFFRVSYLGHGVGNNVMESKADIVKKILQAAKAVNKKHLRSLNFGFDRLLPKIHPEFAAIGLSVPLSDMIKKDEPNT